MHLSRTADKIMVRLPDGLRDKLALAAKQNGRSTNSEVVWHLSRAMERRELLAAHIARREADEAAQANISSSSAAEHLDAGLAGAPNVDRQARDRSLEALAVAAFDQMQSTVAEVREMLAAEGWPRFEACDHAADIGHAGKQQLTAEACLP